MTSPQPSPDVDAPVVAAGVTSRPHPMAVRSVPDERPAAALDRLAELWEAVGSARSASDVATCVVAMVRDLGGADTTGLLVHDAAGQTARLASCGSVPTGTGSPADSTRGPSAHPLEDGGVLAIDDTHTDATWPAWSAAVAREGVRSARFVGLTPLRGRPLTLELYAYLPHAFDAGSARVIAALARHAGMALDHAARLADLEQDAHTRAMLGQASGLLMERYHLSAEQSLAYLGRSSARAQLSLGELARELVAAQDRAASRLRTPAGEEEAAPDS